MAEKATITLPMLPPSLNVYRNEHWKKQRGEEKTWKDFIAVKWAELGRPEFKVVKITLIFTFPDKRQRDLDNYLATGSKLIGDAIKGRFIPDDGPVQLTGWSFLFQFGETAQTTIIIEAVGQKSEDWQRPTCSLYETCNAPMCPLDKTSLKGIWYPDEEICRSKVHGNLPWVKSQRKIAKSASRGSGFFNLTMLNRSCIIRSGITGLDPDREDGPQARKWMDDHPERKNLTEEEEGALRERMEKCRRLRTVKSPPRKGGAAPFSKPPLVKRLG